MPTDLSPELIQRALRGRFGDPLRYFDAIGSTNTEALAWAKDGAPEGALVVADHQTAGRGRWGRSWFSAPGTLLQFSLILRPALPLGAVGLLTTALGVACADVIEVLARLPTNVKWPNDVTIRGRKVAGILVESQVSDGQVEVAVAGIGINVSWRPKDAPDEIVARATSLVSEAGERVPERTELLAATLASFEGLYAACKIPSRRQSVIDRATARSELLGRTVTARFADGRSLTGTAVRLLPNGALELESEGTIQVLEVAEIEQVRTA